MFKKWRSTVASTSKEAKHRSHEEGIDGQLSEIDTMSSSSSESDNESESDSGPPPDSISAQDDKLPSKKGLPPDPMMMVNSAEATCAAAGQTTIVDLLRREFGPRGTLFSVNSQEYLNERRQKRLVSKKGQVQIAQSKVENRRRRYLTDFFNTMLDLKWRYVLLIFTASFFLSWLAFAVIWWLIIYYRGDLEPGHLPHQQEENDWQPCVLAMYNFASVFLFSVETQHTIGYGTRQTTERCPEAIFMQSIQSVVGVMIQACMVGTIFAKLARPQKRTETLLFSRNAVVCSRDGVLTLLFRLANLRPSHLIEAHVRALVISRKVTDEGEVIPFHQTELKVGVDMEGDEDCLLLIWPTTVVHVIDQDSPFYHMSAKDFYRKHYEVIVCLEGIVEPTGMSIQARSSYLGDEILWGYRFCNVLHFSDGCYRIDYSAFNKVEKVETSVASARHQKDQQPHQKDSSKEASKDHNVNHHQPHQVQILEYPSIEKAKLPPNYIATCSSNTDQNDGRQSLSMSPMHRRMP